MKENPLFSVLIANYNNGAYLMEAVQSVMEQTYTNWEIILVDDCSTDNSSEIYAQFASDSRIKVFFNESNHGCGYTKRRCAELATAEICGFLDPDDTLTPDALEVMVKEHINQPECSLICSRHNFCDEDLKIKWVSDKRNKLNLSYLAERDHSVEVFASFKNHCYQASVGLNPNFKRAVDQDLYYLLEEQGSMIFIDNVLYNYRLISNSLSIGHYKAMYWRVLAIEAACKRRGLNSEEVVGNMFSRIIDKHEDKYQRIINSRNYKFGFKLLSPFYKTKKKFQKMLK